MNKSIWKEVLAGFTLGCYIAALDAFFTWDPFGVIAKQPWGPTLSMSLFVVIGLYLLKKESK
jgi:hypothetical protein